MPVKLAITGCAGRMGARIAHLALADRAVTIAAAVEVRGHRAVGQDLGVWLGQPPLNVRVTDDVRAALNASDVLIEFTEPASTVANVQAAIASNKAVVIGTTGLTEAQAQAIRQAAARIPVVWSPNMSLGVNVLFELARLAAQRLGSGYDVEVVEAHHRGKKDAPSGTAKRLVEVLAQARQVPVDAIPVHAIRAGDIVGDHIVVLAGPAERLELTHRAHSRDVFAGGALRAAQWVAGQPPGLYDMSHVLANGVK
ncbi:MAG: 4-hydroxy-tetrahydrodipicolinate reductase [Candidatus Omnitrophica bacterium]|nr:4-hydroxy-tetrahydrodipicolinate reductase [Candidatus Omnitrophota bacterium]